MGDVAGDLRRRDAVGHERERHRRVVAVLPFQPLPCNGTAVEPRRRSGLEAAERQAKAQQPFRQPQGRGFADAAGRRLLVADMNEAVEECAGGEHDRARRQLSAVAGADAEDAAIADQQILGPAFQDFEIGRGADRCLHGLPVQLAVGLRPRPLHRRALGAVEQPELNTGGIGDAPHQAVEGVDLAHQVPLAEAADGRVAAHLADGGEAVRQQCRTGTKPGRGSGGLAARMAAANNDDVEMVGCMSLCHIGFPNMFAGMLAQAPPKRQVRDGL